MAYSADGTHQIGIYDPATAKKEFLWNYVAGAANNKPDANMFAKQECWFSDIEANGYSDGTTWFLDYPGGEEPGIANPIYAVDTVSELATVSSAYTSVYVKDTYRGGNFYWELTGTADGGMTFAGLTGYWKRHSEFYGQYDVRWYGAVGDGVTDDRAAFVAAIGGYADKRTIIIPKGEYFLSDYLFLGLHKELRGNGSGSEYSQVKLIFDAPPGAAGLVCDAFIKMSGFALIDVDTGRTSIGICSWTPSTGNGLSNSTLKDIYIKGWARAIGASVQNSAPFIGSMARSLAFSNVFEKIFCQYNDYSIYLGASVNQNKFDTCQFWNNTGTNSAQVYFNNGNGNVFINCSWQNNVHRDLDLVDCINTVLNTTYCEPTGGILLDCCKNTLIDGVNIQGTQLTHGTNLSYVLNANSTSNVPGPNDCHIRGAFVWQPEASRTWLVNSGAGCDGTLESVYSYGTYALTDGSVASPTGTGSWVRSIAPRLTGYSTIDAIACLRGTLPSLANNTATTMFDLQTAVDYRGLIRVVAYADAYEATLSAFADIVYTGHVSSLHSTTSDGGFCHITLSGTLVQLTQLSGSPLTMTWKAIKIS